MTHFEDWFNERFKDNWIEVETNIDFTKHKPILEESSLHVHREEYIINDEYYRLLYVIGSDSPPIIEKSELR